MNLTLASIAGQVGCLTLVIIFVALFAGLWLDRYLDTKPLFTIVLLIGSVPVTLFLMFRVVRSATSRIKPVQNSKKNKTPIPEEDSDRE
jgi:F0F1-type ATP synthase assembly protein I